MGVHIHSADDLKMQFVLLDSDQQIGPHVVSRDAELYCGLILYSSAISGSLLLQVLRDCLRDSKTCFILF